MPMKRLHIHVVIAVVLGIAVHALTVWALPRLIMDRIITLGGGDAQAQSGSRASSGVYLPPPTDHTQRRIVMPSPDLLYATCAFDLREGPLRIRMASGYPRYWSIALYASSTDNFFVVNDRKTAGQDIDLTLVGPRQADTASPGEVISPTERGFLLLRLLVNDDPEVRAAAEATRRTLRCDRGRA
ncbi:MAG: DUF1254 domain-containing protein [Gammaproteobacteria bacterium]|nr:DUF1254 domain-containing protein [Gammaproteobacteria bacterium]NBP07357.1 DUF1254 domain-containing protein [Gammaproteobacteria bacterium]NBR17693.1 DUF1254 domain-containing protein [Gammaproteobacteria bacterium]NCW21879.1 DUF1254 domain-containing protein [Gammaproteobacteria bacterium]NDA44108.1 DUF1254 domain-containing protein [Gammaproteobacteria bacterium]